MTRTDDHARLFVVSGDDIGARLDAFVAAKLGVSVHEARRLLDEGRIAVAAGPSGETLPARSDGSAPGTYAPGTVKKGNRLAPGAVVTVTLAAVPVVVPELRQLVILRVDEDLVALEKPGGLPMHPLRPGERGTLANALVARFPECEAASNDPREAGFVHRLDVATGGLVLAARTRKSWEDWRGVMGEGDCLKTYLAEVAGDPPPQWSVDTPIGRHGRSGETVKLGGGRGALPAFTRFETLLSRGDRAVVRAELAHGRAHQVRAHLAGSGFPILGDDRYGTPGSAATSRAHGVDGLHLWAHTLTATDPVTRLRRSWEAPPPTWAAAKFGA